MFYCPFKILFPFKLTLKSISYHDILKQCISYFLLFPPPTVPSPLTVVPVSFQPSSHLSLFAFPPFLLPSLTLSCLLSISFDSVHLYTLNIHHRLGPSSEREHMLFVPLSEGHLITDYFFSPCVFLWLF